MRSPARTLVVLALVGALAATLFVLLQQRPEPIAKGAGAGATATPPVPEGPTAVELAAAAPAGGVQPGAAGVLAEDAEPAPSAPRTSVAVTADGRTWADLVVGIDHLSNEPIAGQRVIVVDAEGERRTVDARDVVLASDLADGVLLALDADTHVPRAFFGALLREHSGPARQVLMHRSGALRVEFVEGTPPAVAPRIHMAPTARFSATPGLDSHLVVDGSDVQRELEPFLALGKSLRHLLEGPSDARWRKRQLRWLGRTEDLHRALTLDGAASVGGWAVVEANEVREWPLLVTELPAGLDLDVYADSNVGGAEATDVLEMRRQGDEAWWSQVQDPVSIAAGSISVVEVRSVGTGGVRGLLPSGARSANVVVRQPMRDHAWIHERDVELTGERAFEFVGLSPGRHTLVASVVAEDGARETIQVELDLAPGEMKDVGVLPYAETGATLTIVPHLVVDGQPNDGFLGGHEDGLVYRVSLTPFRRDGGELERIVESENFVVRGLDPIVVRGLETCEHFVSITLQEFPTAMGDDLHVGEWSFDSLVDVTPAGARVDASLEVATATVCSLVFDLPATPGTVPLRCDARAFEHTTGAEVDFQANGESRQTTGVARSVILEAPLPDGDWSIVVVLRPDWHAGRSEVPVGVAEGTIPTFAGHTRADFGSGASRNVRVDLRPAANLVLRMPPQPPRVEGDGADEDEGAGRVTYYEFVDLAHPQLPTTASTMWSASAAYGEPRLVLWGLLPDTTYRDPRSQKSYAVGAPGSTTTLDL
jgi:hypothetical protein